jgi:pyruvate/2-oxoglutarate dehydrogenase complex dihydrolipoamide acyltransferase (E2) component
MSTESRGFTIEPRNRFVEVNRALVEYEIRPGNTVSFVRLVDLTRLEEIRGQAAAAGQPKPSYTAFVVKALAQALAEFPYANRRVCRRVWWPFGIRLQRFEHRDIAVACERAMPGAECVAFADVLRNADQLSLQQCTEWLRQLSGADAESNQQWREFSGLITRTPPLLAKMLLRIPYCFPALWVRYRGGAALVSSPSKYGVDAVLGSWSWPVGVSFGLVKKSPMVRGDQVVACPSFQLSLNFDRRVMAGAQAARFFARLAELIEDPSSLE